MSSRRSCCYDDLSSGIDWSDSALETMSDSELGLESVDVDVSRIYVPSGIAGLFDVSSSSTLSDVRFSPPSRRRLQSTRLASVVAARSPVITPYHVSSLEDVHRRHRRRHRWSLSADETTLEILVPLNSPETSGGGKRRNSRAAAGGGTQRNSGAAAWGSRWNSGRLPMSAREPCDGKEASPEGASGRVGAAGGVSGAGEWRRDAARRSVRTASSSSRYSVTVKRSLLSWPSNIDSDDRSPAIPPRRRHKTAPRRPPPPPSPPRPTPLPPMSCSISSDATCFMERPLCALGVAGRPITVRRRAVLTRKLRRIARYFHRFGPSSGTTVSAELHVLAVV